MDTEELQHRINIALILLADEHSLKVGDLTFGCKDKNHFFVTGFTNNSILKNITKQSALNELNEIKSLFSKMVDNSRELSAFITDKQIEYNLAFDYGKGGIGICSEKDGQLKWEIELRE